VDGVEILIDRVQCMLSSMPERDSSYAKPLSSWFDLDYFRRRDSWFSLGDRFLRQRRGEQLKWILIGIVLFVCIGWPLAAQVTGNRAIYQAHPVSRAHALFNNRCELCHTDSFRTAGRFLPANAGMATVQDATCKHCHDGPIHHDTEIGHRSCASCHREHRGRAELAQVADAHCTSCHGDLQRHDTRPSPFENVHGWMIDHPEFGLWRRGEQDPGTIRFNHAVHLKPEGVRGSDGKPVILECNQCHREDEAGRFMRPINYEQHCGQCHPLEVKAVGQFKGEKIVHAPHKEPRVVQAALRDEFTQFVQSNPEVLGVPVTAPSRRPLPGGQRLPPVTDKEWSWVNYQLETAERVLFDGAGGCRYCHEVKERLGHNRLPEYATTNIRQRWLEHSVFSHHSHRSLDCLACHERAPQSARTSDVLLPKVGACQQCHRARNGARSDCAECHRYHDKSKEQRPPPKTILDLSGKAP
jgi:hypothetical protein